MMPARFTGTKYMTRGIEERLPAVLVGYLWALVERLKSNKDTPMDYLQVFELEMVVKGDEKLLNITHRQEEPAYQATYQLTCFPNATGKIFVIDDGDHVTMMFADEY